MIDNILDAKPKDVLEIFLKKYAEVDGISIERARRLITWGAKYYAGKPDPDAEECFQEGMEADWYQMLNTEPAYYIYDDSYYFTDLWLCWHLYSRPYLRALRQSGTLDGHDRIVDLVGDCEVVADLGCGVGLSTLALADIFPEARVIGTNLRGTRQYRFCETNGVELMQSEELKEQVDFLFASEYFEHIENAIEHLEIILENTEARWLYLANSFGTRGIGHFDTYNHRGAKVDQKKMGKIFNDRLRELGYMKVKTKLWNNKPALWLRGDG